MRLRSRPGDHRVPGRRQHPFLPAACILAAFLSTVSLSGASAGNFDSPDILVVGDSQLSFGSGKVMLDFFRNFDAHCARFVDDKETLTRVKGMRTTMFGTRATSLQSWVSMKGPAWKRMCEKDKTWGVNASVWGHNSSPKRLYHQMGEGRNYQFCKRGKTPLQAMFTPGYYNPELVFFYLIGNGSTRIAESRSAAESDVRRLVEQLPMETKCVFMTTTPIHTPRRNRIRLKAEANLKRAFAAQGNRCSFVSALTPQAISSIQGKRKYFRRNKSGKVKDPFHPNETATKKFLSLTKRAVCRAVAKELAMPVVAAIPAAPRQEEDSEVVTANEFVSAVGAHSVKPVPLRKPMTTAGVAGALRTVGAR